MKINKWFIPILIVAVNALAVIVKWSSLPELLPAHFYLQGNAGGTMAHRLDTGLVVLTSGISLRKKVQD